MSTRMALEGDGLVDVNGVAARPPAAGIGRIDVHDRALAADLGGKNGKADEAGLLVGPRDRQHRLAAALEPALAGRDHARRALGHGHLESAVEQAADAAPSMAMERRDTARLEVDPI